MAYNLFVRMICKELEEKELELIRSFIIMDVIHTLVRILSTSTHEKGVCSAVHTPCSVLTLSLCLPLKPLAFIETAPSYKLKYSLSVTLEKTKVNVSASGGGGRVLILVRERYLENAAIHFVGTLHF